MGDHWLETALGRIRAGDSEAAVMSDYGWTRLTDAERFVLREVRDIYADEDNIKCNEIAAVIDGLLERTSGTDADRPMPVGFAELDTTPARNGTPSECTVPPAWLQRPHYVDPPSGWAYGFPKIYDPLTDGNLIEWLIRNGYPERLARKGLALRFMTCAKNDEK